MAAIIVELKIVEREDGPWFRFRWEGDTASWWRALENLKARVPAEAREWNPETKQWSVAALFEDELTGIFPHFASALDGMRSQLEMF